MRTCLDTEKWSLVDGTVLGLFLEAFKEVWKCIGNVSVIVRHCSQSGIFSWQSSVVNDACIKSPETKMKSDLKVLHWINQLLLNCVH